METEQKLSGKLYLVDLAGSEKVVEALKREGGLLKGRLGSYLVSVNGPSTEKLSGSETDQITTMAWGNCS